MTSPKTPAVPQASDSKASESAADVALVHHVTPGGEVHIIRRRGDQLEAGSLAPLREGAPIQGEVVSLTPRPSFPLLCDVQTLYTPPRPAAASAASPEKPAARPARRKGPAQVATDDYRANWDTIWSGSKKGGALN